VRGRTVRMLAQRYRVDVAQAERVARTTRVLFDASAARWQLDANLHLDMLQWAAHLHEVGLAVSHSQYHKHGAYLVEYSDMPGFSLRDQRFLAALVRSHRRKFRRTNLEMLPENIHQTAVRLCVLLRLAVLLHRSRSDSSSTRAIRSPAPCRIPSSTWSRTR